MAWCPDLVLMDKEHTFTKVNDVACVMDRHVVEKQASPYLFWKIIQAKI